MASPQRLTAGQLTAAGATGLHASFDIGSEVVYPPVDVDRFRTRPRGSRFPGGSRLLDYERVDLVVRAATELRARRGWSRPRDGALRSLAGPTVTFHGQLDDDTVTEMFEGCLALCFPGTEDFGIAPVEANAAGKPVVAFAAGEALETLEGGVTAVLFRERTVPAVIEAMRRVADLPTPEEHSPPPRAGFRPRPSAAGSRKR